jgi:hypothetical protein
LNSIDLDQQSPERSLAQIKKAIDEGSNSFSDHDAENFFDIENKADDTKFDQAFNEIENQDWA